MPVGNWVFVEGKLKTESSVLEVVYVVKESDRGNGSTRCLGLKLKAGGQGSAAGSGDSGVCPWLSVGQSSDAVTSMAPTSRPRISGAGHPSFQIVCLSVAIDLR